MIGGGAALSAGAGVALKLGGGALPLLAIMLATAMLALTSIVFVVRRNRKLAVTGELPSVAE